MKNVFAKEDMGVRETVGWCRFTSLRGLDFLGIGHSNVKLRIWYPVYVKCFSSSGYIAFHFMANGQTWLGQNYTLGGKKVCELEPVEYFKGLPSALEEYISKGLFYGKTTNKIAVKS